MMELANLHFIRPLWLLLLPVAGWVWWRWRQTNDPLRGWQAAMQPKFLRAMTIGGDSRRDRVREFSLLVGWILGVIAIAGPTWRPEPSPFADDPVAIMVLVKTGETMDIGDLAPSRMERARLKVADFAAARPGKPLGLIAFAGSPHLVLPPTRDTAVVATMAHELSPEIMPKPGDDLAAALRLAARTLGDSGGVIVVVDDIVPNDQLLALQEFRSSSPLPVHFHAIAVEASPELDSIGEAARSLSASVTVLTPDDADIQSIVTQAARSSQFVATSGEGTRWAEAGWWLVPVIALVMLASFRRETNPISEDLS